MIEYLETRVIYENPRPHVRSRHGYFPGLVRLPSGDLLALFVIAEAFEAANGTTWISRSRDRGRTWTLERPLYSKPPQTSDSLKATVLRDGSLIAAGYRFHRRDPEQPVGIAETGGILPGEDIVAFSGDEGRTWTEPEVIPRSCPELLEISGPCVELASGDLLAVCAPYKMPDGSNPSGQVGVLLRSRDQGKTWSDRERFFRSPAGNMTPLESRLCQMPDGRLVALVWAYDYAADRHYPNHYVLSGDDGHTWSAPMDTGHMGQASSLVPLEGDLLVSIHAHRAEDPGICVRLVELRAKGAASSPSGKAGSAGSPAIDGRWNPLREKVIWGATSGRQTRPGQAMVEMFTSLKFGQPSLLHLGGGEFLAVHWSIEDGQGKIRSHRLRIRP